MTDIRRLRAHIRSQIDDLVERGLWLVTCVGSSADDPIHEPQFAYTAGLTEHSLPEVFICGLSFELMHGILNCAGRHFVNHGRPPLGERVAGVLNAFPCVFLEVPAEKLPDRGKTAVDRYGDHLDGVQLFWPDTEGRFPWEPGCNPAMASIQQRLFNLGLEASPTPRPS